MHPVRPPSRLGHRHGSETPAPPGSSSVPPPLLPRLRRLPNPSINANASAAASPTIVADAKVAIPFTDGSDMKGDSYAQALSLLHGGQFAEALTTANATFSPQTQIFKSCLAANHSLPETELLSSMRNAYYQLALAFQMKGSVENANSAFQKALLCADKTKRIDLVNSQMAAEIRAAYGEFRRTHRIAAQPQQHQIPDHRTPAPGATLLPSIAAATQAQSQHRRRTTAHESVAAAIAAARVATGVAAGVAPPLPALDLPAATLS